MSVLTIQTQHEPRIGSKILAEWFGIGHPPAQKLVQKYRSQMEEFGKLVEVRKLTQATSSNPNARDQGQLEYFLNKAQAALFVMLTRGSKAGITIKSQIVNALIKGNIDEAIKIIQSLDLEDLPPDRFVYVARGETTGSFKIGISKHPSERVKQLNACSQEVIVLVLFYRATEQGYQSEKIAHALYESERIRSEWFGSTIDLSLLPFTPTDIEA